MEKLINTLYYITMFGLCSSLLFDEPGVLLLIGLIGGLTVTALIVYDGIFRNH